MDTVERYRVLILTFQSAKVFKNPFLDCTVTEVFSGPSGQNIIREAYWDGENIYRVSFAPTETGIWNYCLSAPLNTGLDQVTRQIECVPYTGDLAIYQHGFLNMPEQEQQ